MTFMYNEYANDGTEFIIFFDHGTHVLKHFDGDNDLDGEIIATGSYDRCFDHMRTEWTAIAEELTG